MRGRGRGGEECVHSNKSHPLRGEGGGDWKKKSGFFAHPPTLLPLKKSRGGGPEKFFAHCFGVVPPERGVNNQHRNEAEKPP